MMVACVTWYGHYIGKLIRQNHREITDGYKRLEDSRADTLMFAARLQTVNEDVTRLNDELAAKMKQLEAAQEESLRKGKLAQLGQLTATVAHEIRNPLNTIRTAAYIMERKLNMRTPELDAQLARINKGVLRCDNIMNELLDFTRTRALQTETVLVDDWLNDLVNEQALKLPAMVKVEFRPGLPGVEARFDASRMSRVVINFLTNASEAMVGRGEDPSTFTTSAPTIIISTAQRAGGVEISCSDNGPGIAEEHLQRIREPLFTTKSFIGTPRHRQDSRRAWRRTAHRYQSWRRNDDDRMASIADGQKGGCMTMAKQLEILVVDDDVDNANSLAEIFEMEGHRVTTANSGKDAIRAYEAKNFDIAFMDIAMPGKNGVESFFEIRKFKPRARVYMMTGYSVETLVQKAIENGALGVLHKPVDLERVLSLLAA